MSVSQKLKAIFRGQYTIYFSFSLLFYSTLRLNINHSIVSMKRRGVFKKELIDRNIAYIKKYLLKYVWKFVMQIKCYRLYCNH